MEKVNIHGVEESLTNYWRKIIEVPLLCSKVFPHYGKAIISSQDICCNSLAFLNHEQLNVSVQHVFLVSVGV